MINKKLQARNTGQNNIRKDIAHGNTKEHKEEGFQSFFICCYNHL